MSRIYADKTKKGYFLKNFFDIFVSFILIIILSPIFFLAIILVYLNLGKPIFFKQKRPGLNGKIFTIYKFRTMTNINKNKKFITPDEKRLTKFGKILRSTSIDELPELLNVLKGEMSLVGPRPLLEDYLKLYSKTQFRRHEVKPGITGLAQICGRNLITWEEKFKFDLEYVENISFALDIKILLITFVKLLKPEGISSKDYVTMRTFKGSKNLNE